MKDKISIIIPFYNTDAEYLTKCIESAINQTYINKEIIVINDGSSLKYDELLTKYKDKIKIINTSNHGVSYARNCGINESTGKWITFLDSDDFLELDSCEKLMKNNNEFDIVISKTYIHNKNELYENSCLYNFEHMITNKEELIESIFLNENNKYTCVDTPWAKLYKKEFLLNNNIWFDENLSNGEDGLFNFIAYIKSKKIYFINDCTYNYRINQNSNCNTYKKDLNIKFSNLLTAYKLLFENNDLECYDKMLSYFALRIFCRLIRKYYSHCETYDDFSLKINDVSNDSINQILKDAKLSNFKNGKKFVLLLYKLKLNYLLYLLSQSKIKIK